MKPQRAAVGFGGVMFGFGKQKKRQETIALVSAFLKPIYEVHFSRAVPVNLARVIVEQSFDPSTLKFGDRTLGSVGVIVHAAEALKAAYSYLDVGQEAQSACAASLGLLVRRAFAPANVASLSPLDHEYLAIMASSFEADRQWKDAMAHLPAGKPVQAVVSA